MITNMYTEIPEPPKDELEKPLPPIHNGDPSKKRKNLRILFLGYIIISIGVLIGIAFAVYRSFGIGHPSTPTPTNTQVSTPSSADTNTPLPSATSTPLPGATFTLQPSLTFTFDPYPIFTDIPYPVSTDILITPEPLTVKLTLSPEIIVTATPIILVSDTPQIPTAVFASIPTKTPTRIKHPCPCSHDLYDCKDFSTHALAQACYDYCVYTGWGDAHQLDKGSSGIVCKGLP